MCSTTRSLCSATEADISLGGNKEQSCGKTGSLPYIIKNGDSPMASFGLVRKANRMAFKYVSQFFWLLSTYALSHGTIETFYQAIALRMIAGSQNFLGIHQETNFTYQTGKVIRSSVRE